MLPLSNLPCEIHDLILTRLPQPTLAQLCLVNQQSYDLCLPQLYRHVHIKIRKQLSQLDKGLQRSPYLAQVVRKHTQHLTLTCRQSSFQWLISNAQVEWCRQVMPNLTTLTLRDFSILPIERVAPFLTRLPSLDTVYFRYCNLVSLHQPESYIPMLPEDHSHTSIYQLPASYYYYNNINNATTTDVAATIKGSSLSPERGIPSSAVKSLVLDWTDFSPTAIDHLLHSLPSLGFVSFGANHNRIKNANNVALTSLKRHCRHIHSLKIALQQIHRSMLPLLITHYGPQLIQLDIQCQDAATLKTVAQHAIKVEQLVIHAVGTIQRQLEQEQEEDEEDDDVDWTLDEEAKDDDNDNDNDDNNSEHQHRQRRIDRKAAVLGLDGIEGIVQQCGELTHMEMIRFGIRDIPSVILHAMAHRRKQQRLQASFTQSVSMMAMTDYTTTRTNHHHHHHVSTSSSWSEKASLALDGDLLAEIRTLFVCV